MNWIFIFLLVFPHQISALPETIHPVPARGLIQRNERLKNMRWSSMKELLVYSAWDLNVDREAPAYNRLSVFVEFNLLYFNYLFIRNKVQNSC